MALRSARRRRRRRPLHARPRRAQRRDPAGARRGPAADDAGRQRRPRARCRLPLQARPARPAGALLDAGADRRRRLPAGQRRRALCAALDRNPARGRRRFLDLDFARALMPATGCRSAPRRLRAGAEALRSRARRRRRSASRRAAAPSVVGCAADERGALGSRRSIMARSSRSGGGSSHLVVVLLIPAMAEHDAFARVEALGAPFKTVALPRADAEVARLSLRRSRGRRRRLPLRSQRAARCAPARRCRGPASPRCRSIPGAARSSTR